MSTDELLATIDLPDEPEPGVAYRVEIPAAIYVSVKSKAELRAFLESCGAPMELHWPDSLLYLGWGDAPLGIADVMTDFGV